MLQVCDSSLLQKVEDTQTCMWVPKNRAIEGGESDSVESLVVPIIAQVLGLIPGIALVVSMVISNERCVRLHIQSDLENQAMLWYQGSQRSLCDFESAPLSGLYSHC